MEKEAYRCELCRTIFKEDIKICEKCGSDMPEWRPFHTDYRAREYEKKLKDYRINEICFDEDMRDILKKY